MKNICSGTAVLSENLFGMCVRFFGDGLPGLFALYNSDTIPFSVAVLLSSVAAFRLPVMILSPSAAFPVGLS